MKKRTFMAYVAIALMVALSSFGCTQKMAQSPTAAKPAAAQDQKKEGNVYKGSVVGKSNKAKTISIQVGQGDKAKVMMVRFDDKTTGLEHAAKGQAAIITWEQRGADKFATVVKPKLAKLPEGVTEIKTQEMFQLVNDHFPMTVIDARPESRFDQGHIPGSISIPVPKLKKMQAKVLPGDKDRKLVFYCGGPT